MLQGKIMQINWQKTVHVPGCTTQPTSETIKDRDR